MITWLWDFTDWRGGQSWNKVYSGINAVFAAYFTCFAVNLWLSVYCVNYLKWSSTILLKV